MFTLQEGMRPGRAAPPARLLRIVAFPFFALSAGRSTAVRQELSSGYFRPCLRQINVCLFFVAFVILLMATVLTLQWAGLIGVQPAG
jgi:hypothetical protein